jgi:hypothetical protein
MAGFDFLESLDDGFGASSAGAAHGGDLSAEAEQAADEGAGSARHVLLGHGRAQAAHVTSIGHGDEAVGDSVHASDAGSDDSASIPVDAFGFVAVVVKACVAPAFDRGKSGEHHGAVHDADGAFAEFGFDGGAFNFRSSGDLAC